MNVMMQCVAMPGWWGPGHPFMPDVTGQYLKSYDPAAPSGAGWEWTRDLAEAMIFDGADKAGECWQQVNPLMPLRPNDGRPNRPLTAFTVAVVAMGEDIAEIAEGILRAHTFAQRADGTKPGACGTCGEPWPCPARRAAGRIKAAATIAAEREEDATGNADPT